MVLCDAQGRLFSAEDVPADERFRPQPQAVTVNQLLRTALDAYFRPAFPPGYDIRYYGRRFGFRRYYGPWTNTDQNMPAPTLESSLLERSLNQNDQHPLKRCRRARSYIVILDRAAGGPAGLPGPPRRSQLPYRLRAMVMVIPTPTPPSAMIELRRLHRYFGRTRAVNDVSFEVHGGQVFGYIGPNGAGKTTSMRILATLDLPTARRRPGRRLLGGQRSRTASGAGWGSCPTTSARIRT